MQKRKYRLKIAYKIFIFTILVSLIPMIFLSAVFHRKMGQRIEDEVVGSYHHISQQYVSNIEYRLGLYESIMGDIASNNLVQDYLLFLQKDNSPEEISIARATILEDVNKYLFEKLITSLSGITLYPMGNKTVLYHGHLGNLEDMENYPWIETILEEERLNYFYSYDDWSKRNVISLYNIVKNKNQYAFNTNKLGLVRLDTFASDLFELNGMPTLNENAQIIILDKDGERLYGTEDLDDWDSNKEVILEALNKKKKYASIDDYKYLAIDKTINKYGWHAILLFDYSSINKQINDGTASIIIINLILYIMLFIVCILFSTSISSRLKILTDKMEKVKSGILVTHPVVKGNDEIAKIDNDFNDMVNKLDGLINENYVHNLERKEAELRALRFQINPHFLYNTLELINSMASVYDCGDIALITQKLGLMFRYNIDSVDSDFTTLREEVNHIGNYYSIERIRFEDNVKVITHIPKELLDFRIPRFILQPLVENAFKHGFRNKKLEGKITIEASVTGGNLYIVVEDDGEGIKKERLAFINSYINNEEMDVSELADKNSSGKGIGLYNVNNRIKLCYGEPYGLRIQSQEGQGTKIIICIPNK